MRNVSHLPFVTRTVSLNPSEVALDESARLQVFAQEKLIGTIHIFDTSPQVVTIEKSEGRFQEKTVANVAATEILISSPEQQRSPITPPQWTVVLGGCRHASDVLGSSERLGTT